MDAPLPQAALPPEPGGRVGSRPRLTLVASSSPPAAADPGAQLDAWMDAVARHQDRQAFGCLFTHFGPKLKGWLWKTGSTSDEAEELVQDAFVLLWRKAAQFDSSRASVGSWLFTIARNLRVDRRRAIHSAWTTLDDRAVEQVADPAFGQEHAMDRRQHDERVRSAMSRLTNDERLLVQLSFYEDMSHSRIAQQMKMPLGTVKTKLRRAAASLRVLLEECRP
ncbi:MAG: sigma-70 family RNA polymerase sigma factor [Vitreoscilla sp.]